MEKTSREYAEKLAREKYISEHSINVSIESYLKAVEETNFKELRDALEKCSKFLNSVQSPATAARNLKKEIDNALNKTKA